MSPPPALLFCEAPKVSCSAASGWHGRPRPCSWARRPCHAEFSWQPPALAAFGSRSRDGGRNASGES